jgi:hypothetical protein
VVLLIRTRAGSGRAADALCEACRARLGLSGGRIQRRVAADVVTGSAANGVLLCPEHLELAEARDSQMEAMGFWLSRGRDPRQEPILLRGTDDLRITIWLAEDGRYLFEAPS